MILGGLFVVPESPRWLLSKDREEDAYKALDRVHKGNDEIDIRAEVKVIMDAKAAEAQESGSVSRWSDLFKGVQKRKFFGAFGILVCQQIGGVQFVRAFHALPFRLYLIKTLCLVLLLSSFRFVSPLPVVLRPGADIFFSVSYGTVFFESIGMKDAFLVTVSPHESLRCMRAQLSGR